MKHFISYPLNSNSTNSIIISTLLWGISINNNEVLAQVLIDKYSKINLKNDFRFEEWKVKHIPEIISDSTEIDTSLVTNILEKCTVESKGTKLICECGFVEILCSDKKLYDRRKPYNLVTSDKCLKCGSSFKLKEALNLVIPAREFVKGNDFEIVPGNIKNEILSMLSQELRILAKKENLNIVEEFIEKQSAKIPGRPIFNKMMDSIERGLASGIICWHPDRLARNSVDGGKIIYFVDTGKISALKFNTFWFEPTPQGKFMLSIPFYQEVRNYFKGVAIAPTQSPHYL